MKFTLLTQAALAISSITGAVANPTPDISLGNVPSLEDIYILTIYQVLQSTNGQTVH
jgi:hypothetical protein